MRVKNATLVIILVKVSVIRTLFPLSLIALIMLTARHVLNARVDIILALYSPAFK